MDPFRSLVGFRPRNGGMADGKNGRMVEWREWLHTYYLRCTYTDTDDDDDDERMAERMAEMATYVGMVEWQTKWRNGGMADGMTEWL